MKNRKKHIEHDLNMFKKAVAFHLNDTETIMSWKLMLAYADKLRKYDYKPVAIASDMVTKHNNRAKNRARKAQPTSLAA